MDENYLDSLLKGVSTDDQKKNNFDKNVDQDATVDIDFSDLDDISLDELDSLDDISLEEMDFDDIDFDDLDVTNLNAKEDNSTKEYIPEEEEFDADDILEGIGELDGLEDFSEEVGEDHQLEELESLMNDTSEESSQTMSIGETTLSPEDIDGLFAELDAEDKDEPLDTLGDVFAQADNEHSQDMNAGDVDMSDLFSGNFLGDDSIGASGSSDIENMDLDDLFSALGIDETEGVVADNYVAGEADLDQLLQDTMMSSFGDGELADIADIGEKQDSKKVKSKAKKPTSGSKEKKSVSEILFGAPDEDDEEEERLYQIKKAEKEAKKAKNKEDKEAKKLAKQEKLALKQETNAKKESAKAEKKRAKEAELLAEYEAEKGAKKVPTPVVVLVFLAFAGLAVIVVLGAKNFNYSQVIKKATDYFERQRYRLAYDEVAGVDVKEEDEELRDRIYTVMYVERLYESYENNMTLNRPDKALDSLLRGLEKYDEHYNEAVVLGIAKDIKSVKEKIINALWNTYGLTEAAAYELMELDGVEYSDALEEKCAGMMPTGE